MKHLCLIFITLVAALPALRAGDVVSRITAVTVYPDRAVITREATASLAAGGNELLVPGLPAVLQDQTLQVSATGDSAATLLDVTVQREHLAASANPQIQKLQSQLDQLEQEDQHLADQLAGLHNQTELIRQWQRGVVAPAGPAAARVQPADLQAALGYGREHLPELAAQSRTFERQRAALQAQIAALEKQISDLSSTGQRETKNVLIRVHAAQAGPLALTLRYTVTNAGWTPGYDARVDTTRRQVQLNYFGNVRQNTGEDWSHVTLTLSTARPSLGGAAPELHPWNLDVWKPAEPMPAQKAALRVIGSDAAPASFAAEAPSAFPQASVATAITSATFKVVTPATVASDNTVKRVPVTTLDLKAAFTDTTTPKRLEAAFLTAQATNTSDYPLLAGPLNAFLDGAFVATSRLATTMPGEKFDLALGADEGVTVTRKLVRQFTEQTGLLSKGRRVTYEFLTTVTNHKTIPVHLVVNDQVPVSRNQQIVVNVLTPPANVAKPDADGKLLWNLDLQPGEKRDLKLEFTVDYPQDVKVTGLE